MVNMNNKLGRTISNLLNPNVLLGSKENLKKFSFQTDDDYNSKSFDIDWNVNEVKKQVATYVDQGKLSPDLADILVRNGTCAPIEFDLLDYKEDIEVDTYNLAKLVLRIVSFYNSLGGYIVFGVAETNPETKFDVVGFEHSKLNIETIKALIKEFTGVRIQIASTSISTKKEDGKFVDIVFLHIPKRPKTERPLQFLKNGPGDNKNKLLFQKEEVYCRRGDECSQAKGNYILSSVISILLLRLLI